VKLTLQTQLLLTPEQAASLEATMRAFNAAADWLAGEAFARKTANKIALQKLFYRDLRERFRLSAQKPRAASRSSAKPTSATRSSAHISVPSPLSPTTSG
jgi:predicted transposase